jgi:hypothetical protein
VTHLTARRIEGAYLDRYEPEDTPMKPRSTVTALLAITETLLAARAKAAQTKQASASRATRSAKVARFLTESRPLFLRIKAQAIS